MIIKSLLSRIIIRLALCALSCFITLSFLALFLLFNIGPWLSGMEGVNIEKALIILTGWLVLAALFIYWKNEKSQILLSASIFSFITALYQFVPNFPPLSMPLINSLFHTSLTSDASWSQILAILFVLSLLLPDKVLVHTEKKTYTKISEREIGLGNSRKVFHANTVSIGLFGLILIGGAIILGGSRVLSIVSITPYVAESSKSVHFLGEKVTTIKDLSEVASPSATLISIKKVGDCKWVVTLKVEGIDLADPIKIGTSGVRFKCNVNKPDTFSGIVASGPLESTDIAYLYEDYGTYSYVFIDKNNKKASIKFSFNRDTTFQTTLQPK